MSLRSTLTRRPLIGRHNHGLSLPRCYSFYDFMKLSRTLDAPIMTKTFSIYSTLWPTLTLSIWPERPRPSILRTANTFIIHFFGPSRQLDYASARYITKADIFGGLVSGHTFPISSQVDSRCTPQFCYLRKSSALLILSGVTV